MQEYQFFLTIYPEYYQSNNPKYLDKLKTMYHQYHSYLEQNLSQEEILAKSEFSKLKTILMNNSFKFDNNIDLLLHNDFDETDVNLLNNIYELYPFFFKDLVEKDIQIYIENIIKRLPKKSDNSGYFALFKNMFIMSFNMIMDEKKNIIKNIAKLVIMTIICSLIGLFFIPNIRIWFAIMIFVVVFYLAILFSLSQICNTFAYLSYTSNTFIQNHPKIKMYQNQES